MRSARCLSAIAAVALALPLLACAAEAEPLPEVTYYAIADT